MTADGPIHLDESLTRAKFEELTSDLLERTKKPFRDVMAEAGVTVSEIDHVVLVGGSTRMPAVTEVVKELTGGREPNKGVNPDEVVAVGAALQAGVIQGDRKDVLLIDVTPAVPGYRNQGWRDDQADRAQHRNPDQAFRDLHHRRGQPALRDHSGLPG